MNNLLLDWAIPSGAGFVFGYLTCLLVSRVVLDEDAPSPERRQRAHLARTMFGVLLVVMASVTFVRSYEATNCIREGIIERSDAQGRETEAQIVLLEAQVDADPNNDFPAVGVYLEAARELERVRAANPLRCY